MQPRRHPAGQQLGWGEGVVGGEPAEDREHLGEVVDAVIGPVRLAPVVDESRGRALEGDRVGPRGEGLQVGLAGGDELIHGPTLSSGRQYRGVGAVSGPGSGRA